MASPIKPRLVDHDHAEGTHWTGAAPAHPPGVWHRFRQSFYDPRSRKSDRYIGYYEPYATSHDGLDRDTEVQEEVRNVARAVAIAVRELRAGKLCNPTAQLTPARAK